MSRLAELKIGIVGGGNMAAALIGGLIERGARASAIELAEPDEGARARLVGRYAIHAHPAVNAALGHCDAVILAVKPQHVHGASGELRVHRGSGVVVSIAAGIRSVDLARWLAPGVPIVRAMPNTPALIGQGISGLFAAPGVTPDERAIAAELLGAVGTTVWVDDEALLDVVTAVSGSGPAYFFYFMEALEDAAVRLGMARDAARLLAVQTCAGAAGLALQSGEPLASLRERVTSKGGTTFAGLEHLRLHQVAPAISGAVTAATDRARELGVEFGRD
jgi:pyrroline-5-carboxylate reductase